MAQLRQLGRWAAAAYADSGNFTLLHGLTATRALTRLLPELPLAWVEFKVGQMGVFVAECRDLVTYHPRIRQLADARDPGARPEAASAALAASSGLF